MAKFLKRSAGVTIEEATIGTSAGAGDAGKLAHLDGAGRLDMSLLPSGTGPNNKVIQASEALASGDFVNIHDVAGAFRVRKADASGGAAKKAWGYVLAVVLPAANATVYFDGTNIGLSGLTAGPMFLSATAGLATAVAPTGVGVYQQEVGVAISVTEINVEIKDGVVLV